MLKSSRTPGAGAERSTALALQPQTSNPKWVLLKNQRKRDRSSAYSYRVNRLEHAVRGPCVSLMENTGLGDNRPGGLLLSSLVPVHPHVPGLA